MQNRRIIDRHLAEAGVVAAPTVEANSMMLLYMHVRTGEWASIIPSRFAESLDRPAGLRAIPLVEPDVTHEIGLIVPGREPFAPLIAAFVATAAGVVDGWAGADSGRCRTRRLALASSRSDPRRQTVAVTS